MTLAGIILMTCLKSAAPDLVPELPASSAEPVTRQPVPKIELPAGCVEAFKQLNFYKDRRSEIDPEMSMSYLYDVVHSYTHGTLEQIREMKIILSAFSEHSVEVKSWLMQQREVSLMQQGKDNDELELTEIFTTLNLLLESFDIFISKKTEDILQSNIMMNLKIYASGLDELELGINRALICGTVNDALPSAESIAPQPQ